jgi:uncharacterized protein (DUF952 family)
MIYRISNNYDWEIAQENNCFISEDLIHEGFIHCSTVNQILKVANSLYRGQTNLVLLEIEEHRLNAPLKWEDTHDSGELFPHIYGPICGEAIARCLNFIPDLTGNFSLPDNL